MNVTFNVYFISFFFHHIFFFHGRCRETHKVAVIYVGKGQETRNEILSNRCGSPAYEAFLAALAWEVSVSDVFNIKH